MIRGSGILLHVTSLPSRFGIGDLGPGAYQFVDFLAESAQSYWQILPLTPTHRSPYHSTSAFAGNPLLLSPEQMVRDEWLEESDLADCPSFPDDQVDFEAAIAYKEQLLERAFQNFMRRSEIPGFQDFCRDNAYWLMDYASFIAFRSHFDGRAWIHWPQEIREREPDALNSLQLQLQNPIRKECFLQFLLSRQWTSLKAYCNGNGIQVIGDLPIYMTHDSADLWAHPELFKLGADRLPSVVAGVPPDYFSETGQLWGNPVYDWDALQATGYEWWVQRFSQNLAVFDVVRIDHFRGLVAYWEVAAGSKTAIHGKWVEVPTRDFFNRLMRRFPCFSIVAEDLGYITADVREVMREFGFPGMKLLIFAFGPDLPTNPYIPHNLDRNCVAYTGTHDNNTIRGWFENEVSPEDKQRLFQYLGRRVGPEDIHWEMIRLVMMSVADVAVFPMQDILGLGQEARMNRPASNKDNWQWRLIPEQISESLGDRLGAMTRICGRAP
jgi:4-alpha-glucanotransferase